MALGMTRDEAIRPGYEHPPAGTAVSRRGNRGPPSPSGGRSLDGLLGLVAIHPQDVRLESPLLRVRMKVGTYVSRIVPASPVSTFQCASTNAHAPARRERFEDVPGLRAHERLYDVRHVPYDPGWGGWRVFRLHLVSAKSGPGAPVSSCPVDAWLLPSRSGDLLIGSDTIEGAGRAS